MSIGLDGHAVLDRQHGQSDAPRGGLQRSGGRDVVDESGHQELLAVHAFNKAIRIAADEYLLDPLGIPLISNWNRVTSAIPDFFDRLREAVDQDNGGKR